ncbi:unnamed protein product [Schistosoma curassoni]|uniref:H(+)-exporting diphosphatase n=1 Tax=Schistosoma curassoni TaxID=6186 RepID=A0A183K5N1_9TREM|nr:unnamed protein product [Schistosoma curassoni]
MWSILVFAATSAFSASAGMLSGTAALPLLIFLMAMLIYSIVGGSTLIGRSVGAASILGGFSGAGRFEMQKALSGLMEVDNSSELTDYQSSPEL